MDALNNTPYARKACGPCIALKAKCTHTRPCARCVHRGVECVDVERKVRPKKPKQYKIPLTAVEIVAQLLPTLSSADLQQLNLPNLITTESHTPPLSTSISPSILDSLSPSESVVEAFFNPNGSSPSSSSSSSTPSPPHSLFPSTPPLSPLSSEFIFGGSENTQEFDTDNTTIPQTNIFQVYYDLPLPARASSSSTSSTSPSSIISPSVSPNSTSISPATPFSYQDSSNSSLVSQLIKNGPNLTPNDFQSIATTTTTSLSEALVLLARDIVSGSPNDTQAQVMAELQAVRKSIDGFLAYVQAGRPKEINVSPAMVIANPQSFTITACNQNFLKLIGCQREEEVLGTKIHRLPYPNFARVIQRDMKWFISQKIYNGERYSAIKHTNGSIIYCKKSFQLLGPNHTIITVGSILESIPPCLDVAFYHYLGISSLNKTPEPIADCSLPYCHCKMLHLPFYE